MKNNKSIYIRSVEANDLYCHMIRGFNLKDDYVGMIPFSLELLKLKSLKKKRNRQDGFTIFTVNGKEHSDDVINVKFKQTVKSGEKLSPIFTAKIDKINEELADEKQLDKYNATVAYRDNLQVLVDDMNDKNKSEKWQGLSVDKLREYLYTNGFTITNDDGTQTKYVVYKRSGSKSRQGQCLFVKESLYKEMINWSRMRLPLQPDMEIDLAGLLAYESLVGSSLEDTIHIDPKKILIVDDLESKFTKKANVVKKGKDGFLESVTDEAEIINSLFDGESLLDAKYYEVGVGMKLLRNHFFKSAAFNCNIQQFLKDNCPDGIEYDEWKIKNVFGESMLAKDIELIITPSSLKALKYSFVLDNEMKLNKLEQQQKMWNHWKRIVKKDGSLFGVCKSESKSKRGTDEQGNVLQQMSYQMLNSIPMTEEDMKELATFERNYIQRLKDDDDFFIKYLIENANDMNSHTMFADVYHRNKKIVNTEMFRMFRSREISSYQSKVKSGKVRVKNGDYAVLLGNPIEFLFHAIGKLNDDLTINGADVEVLKGNEVHTTLFKAGKEYLGFRNPHTYAGNLLLMRNTKNSFIKKYFNLSDNIVAVNSISFEIQSILSGADFDSDTMLIVNNDLLLGLCKQFINVEDGQYVNDYGFCVKEIASESKKYELNVLDMAKIDNKLSKSQRYIGSVVNQGQLALSLYWHYCAENKPENEIDKMFEKVCVSAILSEISIDLAKKFFDIDIKREIKIIQDFNKKYSLTKEVTKEVKQKDQDEIVKVKKNIPCKPVFFTYVSQSKDIKDRVALYNTPMDYLQSSIETEYADDRENVYFMQLLIKGNSKNANYKQEKKVWGYVEDMDNRLGGIYADTMIDEDEKNNLIDMTISYFKNRLSKLEIKKDTMYKLLNHMRKNKAKTATKLMKLLHETQKDTFLAAFKNE